MPDRILDARKAGMRQPQHAAAGAVAPGDPPEALPAVIAPLLAGDADFVIGSRYIDGGGVASSWGVARRLNSRLAQLLAAPLVGTVRDPMSGFFSLHRNLWLKRRRLNPIGYKIGLELMCRCAAGRIMEIPITFRVREHGFSKLTTKQRINYLRHLGRLYCSMIKRAVYPRPRMGQNCLSDIVGGPSFRSGTPIPMSRGITEGCN